MFPRARLDAVQKRKTAADYVASRAHRSVGQNIHNDNRFSFGRGHTTPLHFMASNVGVLDKLRI
jgi:hypothetical protein